MSFILPVFDPVANNMRVLSNILVTSVTFVTGGVATVTIPAGLTSLAVLVEAKTTLRTYSYSYNATNGNLTISCYVITRSATTSVAVTGLTVTTKTAITSLTVTTGSAVTGVTTGGVSVVTGITVNTGSVVSGVGDDIGKWTTTGTTLYHTHVLSMATVVTGVTPNTATALSSITLSSGTVVAGITTTTGSVVSSVTISTGVVVTDVSVSVSPLSGETVTVIVMW